MGTNIHTNPLESGRIARFIGRTQKAALRDFLRGPEGKDFRELINQAETNAAAIPAMYAQDGKGINAMAFTHLFKGGRDVYLMEMNDSEAFGLGRSHPHDAEFSYFDLQELRTLDLEIDLHFTPQSVGVIKDFLETRYSRESVLPSRHKTPSIHNTQPEGVKI